MDTKQVTEKQSTAKKAPTSGPGSGKGGARPGAGRKPGVRNKKTAGLLAKVQAEGETPLEFLLGQMRDPALPRDVRIDCAKAAAPYVHSKLASIEMNANVTNHEAKLEDLE